MFGPLLNSDFIRETLNVLLGPSIAAFIQTSAEGNYSTEIGGCVLRQTAAIVYTTFANRKTRNILLSAATLAAWIAGHDGKNSWARAVSVRSSHLALDSACKFRCNPHLPGDARGWRGR